MQARIKQDSRYKTLRLFFGREFNQTDWTPIPVGFEDQATANEFLDTRLAEDVEAVPVKTTRGKVVTPAAPVETVPAVETENVVEVETPIIPLIPAETPNITRTFTHSGTRHGGK